MSTLTTMPQATSLVQSPGLPPNVLPEDIQIGALSLVQGSGHPLLKAGSAKLGDIYHVTQQKVLSSVGGNIEVVPITSLPVWHWYFIDNSKKEFLRTEARTDSNQEYRSSDFSIEQKDSNGVLRKAKPFPGVEVIALIASDIEGLPVKIHIRKSSYWGAGKAFETLRFLTSQTNKPIYSKIVKLGSSEQSYAGNDFFVFTAAADRNPTETEFNAAKLWEATFKVRSVSQENSSTEDYQVQEC